MKAKRLILLERTLRLMAKIVLIARRPQIVGVTGSVGKTSAKEAIAAVLATQYRVRQNEKNYNNEIGIPLTIIGAKTGGRSLGGWLKVAIAWLKALVCFDYPQILVLEMGVDRPGDMQYLLSFVKPTVAVVTNISSSHIEFFGSLNNIAKEKGFLVEALPKEGLAVLNFDNEYCAKMQKRSAARVSGFGFTPEAQIKADNVIYNYTIEDAVDGLSFKLLLDGSFLPIRLRTILAKHQVYAALAACAVAQHFKINAVAAAAALENFNPPCGRMRLFAARGGAMLIDDSYNASPVSTLAALDVLFEIRSNSKIAILADMLELGAQSAQGHEQVVHRALEGGIDQLLLVGKRMRVAGEKYAQDAKYGARIHFFADPDSVAAFALTLLGEKTLVLIKGSQGMRMEKVVRELLAENLDAKNSLCRQDAEWLAKPFLAP